MNKGEQRNLAVAAQAKRRYACICTDPVPVRVALGLGTCVSTCPLRESVELEVMLIAGSGAVSLGSGEGFSSVIERVGLVDIGS